MTYDEHVDCDRDLAEANKQIEQLQAEVKALKERIDFAVDYLPECPDKAKSFLKGR